MVFRNIFEKLNCNFHWEFDLITSAMVSLLGNSLFLKMLQNKIGSQIYLRKNMNENLTKNLLLDIKIKLDRIKNLRRK